MKTLQSVSLLLAVTLATVALSGCASNSPTGVIVTPTGFSKIYTSAYTLGSDQAELLGFSFANNTATSILNLSAPTVTGSLVFFDGVAADTSGNIYSILRVFNTDAQTTTCSIEKYSATAAAGIATPLAGFTSSALCGDDGVSPSYLGIDSAGNFYAVGGGGTAKYAASSMGMSGDVAPSIRIHGAYADEPGAAYVDAAGNLYATPFGLGSDTIAFYAAGFNANTVPVTFTPATKSFINAVWADSTGKIYLVDENAQSRVISVDVYPAGATSGTPTRSISGVMTGLSFPSGIATDATGTIFVADGTNAAQNTTRTAPRHDSVQPAIPNDDSLVIREYGPTLSGNVPPTATLTTTSAYEYGSGYFLQ